ncbi:MAG: hypothetical protein RBT71_09980 [Flavobacteriales bacterium]|nr:hypothetical protein [Flavobacteriales bacterium]
MRTATCLVLLVPALLAAQAPVAELDTAVVRIGERMVITLRMDLPPGGVQWPVVTDTLARHIEVLHAGPVDTIDQGEVRTLRQRIAITSFDTGHWAVPPFRFEVGGTLPTGQAGLPTGQVGLPTGQAVALETRPLLGEVRPMPLDSTLVPRPPQGIIDPPVSTAWLVRHYGPWAAAALALVVLLVSAVRRLRQRRPSAPAPAPAPAQEPPHVRALAGLRAVEAERLWQDGHHKEHHDRITDLLRAYIEERYQVPALERTTSELVQELRTSALPAEQQRSLHGMLTLADMVKFAKLVPAPTENEALLRDAVRFVESTAPPLSIAPDHAPRP